MEFLKKHYEKILLSVVLLCLALTAAWFPAKINKEKEESQGYKVGLPTPKALPPIDLTTNEAALQRLQHPPTVVLSGEHNLFNPVTWKVKSDGSFLKILREGVEALTVTAIQPLYLEISYERATPPGYWIGIKRMSIKRAPVYAKVNEKKDLFTIKDVKGPTENPNALDMVLTDTGETVSITKDKPYQKVEGYAVDLRYDPDNLSFPKRHINDIITFGGESYKIIAITANDVRVQAISTDKRTTIPLKSTP
jgi:hypothetical protein